MNSAPGWCFRFVKRHYVRADADPPCQTALRRAPVHHVRVDADPPCQTALRRAPVHHYGAFLCALSLLLSAAATPDPTAILKAVDANLTASSSKSVTRMVIHGKRSSRTVESVNYSQGKDKFFTEYTSPPRDKGTKMLKVGSNLWIYSPGTDRTVQISGNMLKQSMMGSDLSYEDFMEEGSLLENYSAAVDGETEYDGRACWILSLSAKKSSQAYAKAKIYVDKTRYIILYELLYAKSGKLLKTVRYSDVARIGSRWYPRQVDFKDALKEGKGTQYIVDSIQFDIIIPADTFTKAKLKK